MEIKWGNVFIILIVVFAIYLFVKVKPAIDGFFDNFGSTPVKQDVGTMMTIFIGMGLLTIIVIVHIICNKR